MELIKNEFQDFLKKRMSARNFIYKKIPKEVIENILDCGRWAPSEKNSQPWHVCVVIHPTVKRMLSELLSKDGGIVEEAYVNLVVFLDLERSIDRTMDLQAIGAFMQNILLGVHFLEELGSVWIGEILSKKKEVNEIFKYSLEKYELMGIIAVGIIDEAREKVREDSRERRSTDDITDWY
ncbi:MAG: nitroreductase family protein [Promethearchaeota archaeon]|jgi:nitroreductase